MSLCLPIWSHGAGQAALLPSNGGGAGGTSQDSEFQEVSRKGRRNIADGDVYSQDGSEDLRSLSPFASQVAPAVAQRLEQLAKLEGCNLANMLDDRAWSALAALSEAHLPSFDVMPTGQPSPAMHARTPEIDLTAHTPPLRQLYCNAGSL